jgi:hypothetical protein
MQGGVTSSTWKVCKLLSTGHIKVDKTPTVFFTNIQNMKCLYKKQIGLRMGDHFRPYQAFHR